MRASGAGVDLEVALHVEIGPVVSSLTLLLRFEVLLCLELLDELLAWPGDVGGGVRSTRALISTIAVMTGYGARVMLQRSS